MTTAFRYKPSAEGESLHIKELLEHPNWKGEESKVELKHDSYAIVRESGSNRFCILWLNKKGEAISVPFWTIEAPTFKWCFRNGQANIFAELNELIVDVFKHFKEKDM